jgi:hypothetical protein
MAFNISTSKTLTPDLEILVNQVNVDVAASIVLDAATVAPDATTGERVLKAGTPLSKNAVSKQYERYTKAAGQVCLGILSATVRFPDGTAKSDAPAAMWHHGQWFRSDRIVDWATLSADIKSALPTCKFT